MSDDLDGMKIDTNVADVRFVCTNRKTHKAWTVDQIESQTVTEFDNGHVAEYAEARDLIETFGAPKVFRSRDRFRCRKCGSIWPVKDANRLKFDARALGESQVDVSLLGQ